MVDHHLLADMNFNGHSSVHINDKGKDILILGKGPTQRLDGTTFTAKVNDPIDFTQPGKDLY